ncbi:phosphatase PAP2 family protein [Sulfurimonas sp. HSL-3221]|uniref:phosphatase PAP2 family protein n=1 Tax=Sulfurimonadaceae TaxID=2771471 RepID=UPI001E5BD670|nr:phosphatase PAP2 family protein [Sulfurimonas sp. HSL-3221]UFS63610.1 phosphatase PAP2 family protein [Sulfurimonas sp. HSL-3221]
MNKKILCIPAAAWGAMAVTALLLYLFPQIDIAVSSLFYTPGEGFAQGGTLWERFVYQSVGVVLAMVYVAALLLWLYNRISGRVLLALSGKKLLYILLVAALGSGIFVNLVLKQNWGRPRPDQTSLFGSDRHFTPAFVMSDQRGKSFSSGHTSGAFALLALIFLARRHRKTVALAVIAYGSLVSLARIAAGGHFFSDVLVSIMIMYIVSGVLYARFFGCNTLSGGRE